MNGAPITKPEIQAALRVSPLEGLGDFRESTLRIRRNLLVASLLGFAVQLFRVRISAVAGFTFSDVATPAFRFLLLATILYNLVSYCWHAIDEIRHWRWSGGYQSIRDMTQGWKALMERNLDSLEASVGATKAEEIIAHEKSFLTQVKREQRKGTLLYYSIGARVFLLELAIPITLGLSATTFLIGLVNPEAWRHWIDALFG